jgi:phosphoglycerate kinase
LGLDVGPKSIELFSESIKEAATILWNGPMGVFEFANFSKGSKAVLDECVKAKERGAIVVIGGGDTATVCSRK